MADENECRITFRDDRRGGDSLTTRGPSASDERDFATTLFAALRGMRAVQAAWGNGEDFGGDDPATAAAHFLLLAAEHEQKPGGWWYFDSDEEAAREGCLDRLVRLRELVRAARAFLPDDGGAES